MHKFTSLFSTAVLSLALTACAGSTTPKETHDGLVEVPDSKFGDAYMKPGADLSHFDEYGVTPCQVAFKKNWLRDQNSSRIDLSNRVTQKDVDRIKDTLAAECDTFFREALLEEPAYKLVESFDEGEQVLVIRPNIINLDVHAPDVGRPGVTRTYTTSSGEMTLMLELVDGTTGEVLARVVDRKRGLDDNMLQWSNSVTNKADADRALRRWSSLLRDALDNIRQL